MILLDHEVLARQAGTMETTLRLEVTPENRRSILSWVVRILWPALELHLRKEEKVLFPEVRRLMGEKAGVVTIMEEQHLELRRAYRHVAELVQEEGRPDWSVIQFSAEAFIDALEDHGKKTQQLVLDPLKRHLKGKELRNLSEKMQEEVRKAHEEEGWPTTFLVGEEHQRESDAVDEAGKIAAEGKKAAGSRKETSWIWE
ncbi:MAG: hemerythrin domain-containing protein [Candidatus Omnitrophica bacterium]|nr:hemerythrin domain-containing protein [Candidatus Omnitrophota bacterium]